MSFYPLRSVQKSRICGNGEKIRNVQNIPIKLLKESAKYFGKTQSHVRCASALRHYCKSGPFPIISVVMIVKSKKRFNLFQTIYPQLHFYFTCPRLLAGGPESFIVQLRCAYEASVVGS